MVSEMSWFWEWLDEIMRLLGYFYAGGCIGRIVLTVLEKLVS